MNCLSLLWWIKLVAHIPWIPLFGKSMLFQPHPQNLFLKGWLLKNAVYLQAKRKQFCMLTVNKVEWYQFSKELEKNVS